jgi:hypothetical protein
MCFFLSTILFSHPDALANIEQYAIDLAWDIIARFADFEVQGERLPVEFFLDWAKVAEDEAKHYSLLSKRLVVSVVFWFLGETFHPWPYAAGHGITALMAVPTVTTVIEIS